MSEFTTATRASRLVTISGRTERALSLVELLLEQADAGHGARVTAEAVAFLDEEHRLHPQHTHVFRDLGNNKALVWRR